MPDRETIADVVPALTAWYGHRPQATGQWDLSGMYRPTVTKWPATASGSCVTGRNAGLRGRHTAASGLGAAGPGVTHASR